MMARRALIARGFQPRGLIALTQRRQATKGGLVRPGLSLRGISNHRTRSSIALCEKRIFVGQRGRTVGGAPSGAECIHKEQRLGAFPGKFLDPLLQARNYLWIFVSDIGFLIRVLRDVKEF